VTRRVLLIAALALAACGDDNDGTVVHDLVTTSNELPGANCPDGGVAISSGADTNGDGTLDASEVTKTSYICEIAYGQGGIKVVAKTTAESAGANCAHGGTRIDVGVDDNGNNTLDDGEIDSTQYVCDHAPGTSPGGGDTATYGDVIITTDAELTNAQSLVVLRGALIIALDRRSTATDVSFPNLTDVSSIDVISANGAVTLSLPVLEQVGSFTASGGGQLLTGLSIDAPHLVSAGELSMQGIALVSINMPLLAHVQSITIQGTALTTLAFPALTDAQQINLQYNGSLEACDSYRLLFQLVDLGVELEGFAADQCSDLATTCHPVKLIDGTATGFSFCAPTGNQASGLSQCSAQGADVTLAYFDSDEEFTSFVAQAVLPLPRMWIGYEDPDGDAAFAWAGDAANTYLPTSSDAAFWYSGEPAAEKCAELRLDRNVGKADAQNCNFNFPALCRELP
jgi:hypothetical protein